MSKRPTDDLEPAAKKGKRTNSRQLTKDDASDEEEDQVAPGEMVKASAEVLKGRRIIKARRGAVPASAAPAAANPFGAFSLLAADRTGPEPAQPAQTPAAPLQAAVGNSVEAPAPQPEQHAAKTDELASAKSTEAVISTPATAATAAAAQASQLAAEPPEATGPATAAAGTSTDAATATAASSAPAASATDTAAAAPATSSPAAASGGFAGFGKGASGFGGSFAGAGGFGALAGTSAPSFGALRGGSAPAFGFASLGAQQGSAPLPSFFPTLSGTAAPASGPSSSAVPVLPASSDPPKTGEEGETCQWSGEGALFEFAEGWRERGRGELRVNSGGGSADASGRLVMRTKGTARLLLNGPLWPQMAVTPMEGGKGVTFACVNAAAAAVGDAAQPLATFAFRCKDPGARDGLMAAINGHKGQVPPAQQNGRPEANGSA